MPSRLVFRAIIQAGVFVAAAIAFGAAQRHFFPDSAPALYLQSQPLVDGEILAADAWKRSRLEEVAWVDAREESIYAQHHLPGALNLNERNFDSAADAHMALTEFYDKPVFVYCDGAQCEASHVIAGKLQEMRYAEVIVVKDGWPGLKDLVDSE
ncbi:MAG: rhodanese-like domain-containing protein [Verrucomicrobiota bacterium]